MKQRLSLQFAVILFVSVLSASQVGAQNTPKKIIFVGSVGSAPPPVANSSVFNVPLGLAVTESAMPGSITGTIYVADPLNNQVVAFPPGGGSPLFFKSLPCPSTVPGCVANPWPLSLPTFLAAAPNGNLWISDTGADVVLQVDPTGTVVAFAGAGPTNVVFGCSFLSGCPSNPNSGQGDGQFFGPGPLAVDSSGNLYVADAAGGVEIGESVPAANIRLQKFLSDGTFVMTWGSWCTLKADGTQAAGSCNTSAPGAVALGDGQFAKVNGIAVDAANNVYVSEDGNNRVQRFTANGIFLLKWGGLPKSASDGQFSSPGSMAVDLDQTIYVVDIENNRIEEFDNTGHFVGKGGSMGTAEAQFTAPFGIASVPPSIALACLFIPDSDCVNGFFVSEVGNAGRPPLLNSRVQFLAGRLDSDNDGITDEIDLQPHVASTAFSNASLGFTTSGNVLNAGDQTFAIYNVLTPSPLDEIRVRTESFGGTTPLTASFCSAVTLSFPAGTGANVHCSTPTAVAEFGPVGFQFRGTDGTLATGALHTGESLSFDPPTSSLHDNAGNIDVFIGGKTISLTPGQTAFADTTPPTTTASIAPTPNSSQWNKTNVVVTFNATDNPGGSGVSAIAYSLSGAQTGTGIAHGSTTSASISAEGITTVTYDGLDNAGNQGSQKALTVRIDKTPPTLVCSASPSVLPQNERLIPVTVAVTLADALSGPNGFVLSSVTSNERQPDNDVAKDIKGFTVGTPSTSGFLRAERSFRDRMYTLVYTGSDVAGNQASCTVVVKVARHHEKDHDRDDELDPDGDHNKGHHEGP